MAQPLWKTVWWFLKTLNTELSCVLAILAKQKNENMYSKKKKSVSFTVLKPVTVWITTNWKILKEMGIPDHLTCLLA